MPRFLCLLLDDLGDLLDRLVDLVVLVDHDVVVLGRGGHLDLGVAEPKVELFGRLGAAHREAVAERVHRRRHDEDGQCLGEQRFDLPHPLRLRLDDDDPMLLERVGQGVAANTLEVAVDHRPLEEVAGLDLLAELLRLVEVVVRALDLAGPRLAARRGHVHDGVGNDADQAFDDRVLPPSRRRGDDDQETAAVDAQRTSPNGAAVTVGAPSAARYARRSSASGAVKVRGPLCGRFTDSLHACRN